MKKVDVKCRQVLIGLLLMSSVIIVGNVLAADGKSIYNQTCIACHGEDGTGMLPGLPDFTDSAGSLAKTDEELIKNIKDGYQSPGSLMAMPAKGGNSSLTDNDLINVLQYLRQTFGS